MTAIAVPIFVKSGVDLEEAISAAEEALEGTAGMIELRCDAASPKQLLEAIDLARVPVIVTVRSKSEGGIGPDKTDDQRIDIWEAAIEAGAEYIDVELVTWEKSRAVREALAELSEKSGTRLIISNHSFEGRPKDLDQRLQRLRTVKEAAILKIVWKAESILDAIDALKLSAGGQKKKTPLVALVMGEEGILSRLLAKKFGAPFTFASVERGKESAPGQPTVADLRELYRWETQKADTPVFGVIGWPVGHSLSPHIHNAGFAAAKFDGVYVPLAIRPTYEAFAIAVDALRTHADLRGLSVTIPHKENAFRYAREHHAEIDELSAKLAVVNTLHWRGNKLIALNSDYAGALDALSAGFASCGAGILPAPAGGTPAPQKTDLSRNVLGGKRIAVLGAGGAARAIVAGLAAFGATVVIYNRTREKADALAAEFTPPAGTPGKVVAADWDKLCDSCCEAYINCTPLGMHPKVDQSPIDFDPAWTAATVVFDTVYNPLQTKLLKLAAKKGAKVIPGTEMFVRQAAIQFKEFTGKNADVDLFRKVLLQELTA